MSNPTRMGSSILLVVDDWEALERYEEKLSRQFGECEACPLGRLGLERARERNWDVILFDLTSEDLTPDEARAELGKKPAAGHPRVIWVGGPEDAHPDLKRPFRWEDLIGLVTST
jgi:DNA-binding response OmpR family regulator